MKTLYKHTQYGKLLVIVLLLSLAGISYAYYYQTGVKPIPLPIFLIVSIILIVAILFFYKLTIQIDQEKITAIFGIGILKKSFDLKDIETIEKYKIPWYAGIGIRLTPKGWLWNVSYGDAVLIKGKNNTFLVGTNEVDVVIEKLKN